MTRRLTGREHAARTSARAAVERARAHARTTPADVQQPAAFAPAPRPARDDAPVGLDDPVRWRRRCRQIRDELESEARALGHQRHIRWAGCPCGNRPTRLIERTAVPTTDDHNTTARHAESTAASLGSGSPGMEPNKACVTAQRGAQAEGDRG
ncbi:hypothetical protein ACIA8K_06940 [Catenuloplanes sp. NPDC051500]|uniref:hypothetical protein n=1 Tax=Catenuloplanes sp. NPDC051500 TaxID=3363959 RepID=UPI0037B5CA78